jgi:hypothetical protein
MIFFAYNMGRKEYKDKKSKWTNMWKWYLFIITKKKNLERWDLKSPLFNKLRRRIKLIPARVGREEKRIKNGT